MAQPAGPAIEKKDTGHRLWRVAMVASIIGVALVVAVWLIIRALPKEGEAQVEIAGWRVPVGVVVNTDSASSHVPGIVLRTLLGNKPLVQINAGRVVSAGEDELRVRSIKGGKETTYKLTGETKTLSIRSPLLPATAKEGDAVAVLTAPGSDGAVVVLTGVTLSQ